MKTDVRYRGLSSARTYAWKTVMVFSPNCIQFMYSLTTSFKGCFSCSPEDMIVMPLLIISPALFIL